MDKIGLIAGNRSFPVLFVEEAVRRGVSVSAVCIKGETDPRVARLVGKERCLWVSLGEFTRGFDFLKQQQVFKVVMCGQISPYRLFSREVRESPSIQELLSSVSDKRANTIFAAISRLLEKQGFEILSSTTFLDAYVPATGVMSRRQPTPDEQDNLRFAFTVAKAVAGLDIGLSVAVKSKAVIAVEALEGTDRLISRAGALAGRKFVVAKVGRPGQDMRFDIPVIGLATMKVLARSGATCLAIEAGKTLFLDKKAALAYADRKGLCLIAV